ALLLMRRCAASWSASTLCCFARSSAMSASRVLRNSSWFPSAPALTMSSNRSARAMRGLLPGGPTRPSPDERSTRAILVANDVVHACHPSLREGLLAPNVRRSLFLRHDATRHKDLARQRKHQAACPES